VESRHPSFLRRIKKRTKNDQRTPCRSTQHIRRPDTKKLNTSSTNRAGERPPTRSFRTSPREGKERDLRCGWPADGVLARGQTESCRETRLPRMLPIRRLL
jgi:hypothetical protein